MKSAVTIHDGRDADPQYILLTWIEFTFVPATTTINTVMYSYYSFYLERKWNFCERQVTTTTSIDHLPKEQSGSNHAESHGIVLPAGEETMFGNTHNCCRLPVHIQVQNEKNIDLI